MDERLTGEARREHVKRETWRRNWTAVEQFVRDTNERLGAQAQQIGALDMRLTAMISRMQSLEAEVQSFKATRFGTGPTGRK